uniref:cysteine dioxygenase n=1 Tax=Oryza sativa subsp. japonica TaxID=39947 RepID=Q6Z851_ORYSJ|nr:HGWP repeat containing protein-like [Oryza sativa Japonica Group]
MATLSSPLVAVITADRFLRHHDWLIPPPSLMATLSSPPAAVITVDRFLRQHGWCIPPPSLMATLPSPPTAVIAADRFLRHHGWCTLPPPLMATLSSPPAAVIAADRFLRHHSWCTPPLSLMATLSSPPAAVIAADWFLRHHGWCTPLPLLTATSSSQTGLPSLPPTGVSAYTAGLLCHRCWASTTSPSACLYRCRLEWISQNITNRLAFAAADWCSLLYGWLVTLPLLGVYVFTTGLPSPPPTGVSACMAGLLCRRCWATTSSPTGCLATVDWHLRLHGWPIMPSLLGVYVFTDRLAFATADWCLRLHDWPIMPLLLGVYVFTDRLAFAAADCWPIMPLLLGVYVFTTGSPSLPLTGVFACTVGLLCRRCRTSTSSPTGRLV